MNDGPTLANIGDLAKPFTALIEKIASATGIIFEPTQIKRIAKAKVEADKIRALGEIEVSDIQQRALTRLILEEGKKQENMESILTQAATQIKDDAKPKDIDDDWIANFFDKCKLVSDEEMQSLWGSLLAGEANKPGSFTKRTVELVASLEKKDAHLFTTFCGFCWFSGGFVPLIYDFNHDIYNRNGINFSALCHLEDIGLIKFNTDNIFIKKNIPKKFSILYFQTQVTIEFINKDNAQFSMGQVTLTKTGKELASICGAKEVDGFLDYTKDKWKDLGYIISIPYQANTY